MSNRLLEVFTDPLDMIKGIRTQARGGLRLWGPALILPQAIGGLVFINRPAGFVVFAGLIAMLLSAGYIHRHAPLSRLIGICQVWWLLTIPWLFRQALDQEMLSVFSIWLWYVVTTMIISLLLDVYGFHQYLTSQNRTYSQTG
ncbi:MAG: hypothetical protein NXI27_16995 [Alphaproteobacteria bacterium]|nr:hypothetical protein [Alphaproteobacteria bacterium]